MGSKSSTPAAPSAANANSTQQPAFGAGGGTGANGLGTPTAGSYAANGSQISFGTGNPADFSSQQQQLQNAYGWTPEQYASWASNPINSSQVVSNPTQFQAQAQAGQTPANTSGGGTLGGAISGYHPSSGLNIVSAGSMNQVAGSYLGGAQFSVGGGGNGVLGSALGGFHPSGGYGNDQSLSSFVGGANGAGRTGQFATGGGGNANYYGAAGAPNQQQGLQIPSKPYAVNGGSSGYGQPGNGHDGYGSQSATPGGSSYGRPPTMQPAGVSTYGGSAGGAGASYAPVDNSSGAMSIPLQTSAGSAAQSGLWQAGVTNAGYGQIQNQLANQDLTGAFNQQQQAAYNGQMAYLQPQQTQQTQQQIDALAQQGITQSSNPTAYANAMNLLHNQQAYTNQQAYNSSFANGLAGANQLFNQGLQSGQFANSAQAQGFNQSATNAGYANTAALQNAAMGNQVGMYNAGQSNSMNQFNAGLNNSANTQQLNDYTVQAMLPYNQLAALNGMTSQYTTGSPTLGSTNQSAGQSSPNLMQASQNNYNSQLAGYNNQQSGLFGLGSAAIMALA